MKKTKHFRIIILNEDFGNNTKGTVMRCEAILASRLITKKVADLYDGELKPGSVAEQLEKSDTIVKPTKKTKKK